MIKKLNDLLHSLATGQGHGVTDGGGTTSLHIFCLDAGTIHLRFESFTDTLDHFIPPVPVCLPLQTRDTLADKLPQGFEHDHEGSHLVLVRVICQHLCFRLSASVCWVLSPEGANSYQQQPPRPPHAMHLPWPRRHLRRHHCHGAKTRGSCRL